MEGRTPQQPPDSSTQEPPQVRGSHAAQKQALVGEGETVCVLSRAVLLDPKVKHIPSLETQTVLGWRIMLPK